MQSLAREDETERGVWAKGSMLYELDLEECIECIECIEFIETKSVEAEMLR